MRIGCPDSDSFVAHLVCTTAAPTKPAATSGGAAKKGKVTAPAGGRRGKAKAPEPAKEENDADEEEEDSEDDAAAAAVRCTSSSQNYHYIIFLYSITRAADTCLRLIYMPVPLCGCHLTGEAQACIASAGLVSTGQHNLPEYISWHPLNMTIGMDEEEGTIGLNARSLV